MADLNEYGVDMEQIEVGAVLHFDRPFETGRVIRMDRERLGVVEVITSQVFTPGAKAIFHSLNVTQVEKAPTDISPTPGGEA